MSFYQISVMMEIPQALARITLTGLLCVICYTYISAGTLTANHFPGGCSSDARVFLGLQQTHMESQLLEQQLQLIMKSTEVLNPRRCIMRVYTRVIRMRVHEKNGRLYAWPYNGGSAGSRQRSGFRENPTNF